MANTELLTFLTLEKSFIWSVLREVNAFISNLPFFLLQGSVWISWSVPFSTNRVCCYSGGDAKGYLQQGYFLAEQAAFCHIVQSLRSRGWICSSPCCSQRLLFRTAFQSTVFSISCEIATVNFTAFSVTPWGRWLGTPAFKRDGIMHSVNSCRKVIVFHKCCLTSSRPYPEHTGRERCLQQHSM